jgi:hypothetical protein
MVEPQPSKLMVWVRFPSPAPVLNKFIQLQAHIAQLVERILGKDEVTSSNLVMGSTQLSMFLKRHFAMVQISGL